MLFAQRAVDKSRLAEAAAAQAAALQFQHRAVVDDVDKRHHKLLREEHLVQVRDDPFRDLGGRFGAVGGDGMNGAVGIVADVVQARHIDAADLRGLL